MNQGVKRLAILLGVIGAVIGWFVGFNDPYYPDEFLFGCFGAIEGFLISFEGVHAVYWGGSLGCNGFCTIKHKARKKKSRK